MTFKPDRPDTFVEPGSAPRSTTGPERWRGITWSRLREPVDLRRFAEPCPKCQSEDQHVRWHVGAHEPLPAYGARPERRCAYDGLSSSDEEHLHITCRVCGYDWTTSIQTPRAET